MTPSEESIFDHDGDRSLGPRHEVYRLALVALMERYGRLIEGGWGIPAYIHYMDGRVKKVKPK